MKSSSRVKNYYRAHLLQPCCDFFKILTSKLFQMILRCSKIGKKKLIEAKTKKSRVKVPLIDPQPMQAPPAPASSVDQSSLDCPHCGFKYVFKSVTVIIFMGKPHTTHLCFCITNMRVELQLGLLSLKFWLITRRRLLTNHGSCDVGLPG